MPAKRLQRLTAVCFAVLYGVVGVTGASLHYLLTDPTLLWSSSADGSVGYYHTHGPDYHGHFHRHAHHGHHSHDAHVAQRSAGQSPDETSLSSEESSHQPHACPLLTLVSTLNLTQAGGCAVLIVHNTPVARTFECDVIRVVNVAHKSFPRGPPSRVIA
jgi:hypothetical protein